jgi:type IV pilus assembly protein PilN
MTIRINLLAPERRRRRRIGPVGIGLAVLAAVVLILAVVGIVLQVRVAGMRSRLAEVQAEVERLRPEALQVERMKRAVDAMHRREAFIRQFFTAQIPAAEAILDLSLAIPRDTWITQFAVQGGRAVQVEGVTAQDNESVALFMVNLDQSPRFRNVDLSVSERQRIGTRDVMRFSLTAELEGPPTSGTPGEGGTR